MNMICFWKTSMQLVPGAPARALFFVLGNDVIFFKILSVHGNNVPCSPSNNDFEISLTCFWDVNNNLKSFPRNDFK